MTTQKPGERIEEYAVYRPSFQRHYQVYFGSGGTSFEVFNVAYMFGYRLANEPQKRKMFWDELKGSAEAEWTKHQKEPWALVEEAVYYAWVQIKHFFECGDDDVEFAFYAPSFKRHFEDFFSKGDLKYDQIEPVYHTGYSVAMNPRYHFYDWFEIEEDAKKELEETTDLDWNDDIELTLRSSVEAVKRNSRLLHYGEYETTFRRHYYTYYSRPGGKRFAWYESAYRFGFDLAMDKGYRKSNWFAIEF